MKHLRKIYNIVFCLILLNSIVAQSNKWNLLLDKEVARFLGYQVYETDSVYYVVGTSVDDFGMVGQGFSVSKVNKKNASVVASRYYEEADVEFDFNQCRRGYLVGNEIFFPQTTLTKPYAIHLFKVNINTLHVEKILIVPPQDTTSKYDMFLNDFQLINNDVFILTEYYLGEFNMPSFRGVDLLIKYNLLTKESNIIKINKINEKTGMLKMGYINNNIILFATTVGEQIATGKMAIYNLDLDGNVIWQYQTPSLSPIHYVKDIHPINDNEVLLASYDSYFDYSDHNLYTRWTVTRYDVKNKKIVWSNFWNEPRKPYIWGSAKIIKTKNDGEYLLMANDVVQSDTTNYTTGKIVKFNDKGQRLWQKSYYFRTNWSAINDFYNIISTSDGNYLISGYESLGKAPWLVKIDEDGNILPIDTTSSVADQLISHPIAEIKIYPNPASHTIIINQGDISDMTYELIDMTGKIVKSIPLPHAHHHVMWDISDVASGTYVLTMMQGGKLIGSRQQVIIE